MIIKKYIYLIILLGFNFLCLEVIAQPIPELPTVLIQGNVVPVPATWTVIQPVFGSLGEDPNWSGNLNLLSMITQVNNVANAVRDVRCVASGDRRNVTSHYDAVSRFLAATDVAGKIRLITGGPVRAVVVGNVKNPFDGKIYPTFKVTYADGGTEQWMIQPSNMLSISIFDQPLPNSLVLGDGLIKPQPLCSKVGYS